MYVLLALAVGAVAQFVCPTPVTGTLPTPSVAPGYESRLIATGLNAPRGMIFDTRGHLLVIDRGVGVKALTLKDDGGSCLSVASTKTVIANTNLNHAIELTNGGKTLLVSDSDKLYSFAYAPGTLTATGQKTLVNGMDNPDHSTRTTWASKFKNGTVIINRGSSSNIDNLALDKSSGHAQVKVFDISAVTNTPYNFTTDGTLLAWGVRNNVGITEHPVTGGIWTVENSVDNVSRYGTQFNARNPGEKLNYMGTLVNNQSPNQGSNFGYPQCFATWAPADVPQGHSIKVGQQFSIDTGKISDAQCQSQRTAPRLVFNAHMAPLDIKFGKAGAAAFVSFHGSFNRPVPQGYKIGRVAFGSNGQPIAKSNDRTAVQDIVRNQNFGQCNGSGNCFRPTGMAFDAQQRLFFASDTTGEIYVVRATG